MNNTKLVVAWILLKAFTLKVLKYLSIPFLAIFFVLKCIYVIIVFLLALIFAFIKSIVNGDWKV